MRGFRTARFGESYLLNAFVTLITVAAAIVAAATWSRFGLPSPDGQWLEFSILLAVLCWSEMKPIAVVRAGAADGIVASTTFAFAIFLEFGVVMAMIAQAAVSLIGDLAGRKAPIKVVFNIAQYWAAWGAAAFAFAAVESDGPGHVAEMLTSEWYLAVVVAALTYLVVNNVLVGAAIGISQGTRVIRSVFSTLRSEWRSDIVLLALTPIVVIVMQQSVAALPLLLLPSFAVYRSVTISAEKEHLSLHDSLTGLPNRFNFTSVLAARLEAGDSHHNTTVMLFDLDHFKEINDTLGHQAGDELLQMIGPRITGVLPEDSVVARFGGDEYAVLVPTVDTPSAALDIARSIASELETPFRLEGFNIEVKGSLGVAIHPVDGATGDELIKSADIAMYVAKSRGTVVERYDADLDTHSTRRLEMVGEMRTAIAEGSLDLYYQPKLGLLDRTIVGVEALVRWDHPRLGDIPPSEFVPLAEHTGLIRPLTSLVLNEAAEQISRWSAAGVELVVAVNLSARSLHDGTIVDEVARVLDEHGVPPELLRLEITEGSIMADPARAMTVLERLAAMGVRLSIDDFGTGYSSLAYLKDLPVDEIKIDQSFVTNLIESEGDRVIVSAIIDLAVNLGLTSVAEGVESSSALTWLRGAGCNQAQGYHVGRPMPAAALDEWLRSFDIAAPFDDGSAGTGQGDVARPLSSGSPGTRC